MTPARKPQEYIITMSRIIKARNMLMVDGYHNADVLDRVVNLLRARPHTSAPAPEPDHRTYESCHKHFSCPDGEECWYSSADYYWDCGNGATRLMDARIEAAKAERETVLDKLHNALKYGGIFALGEELDKMIKSLRAQQEQPARPIGTCEHGAEHHEMITCHLVGECEFQTPATSGLPFCIREDAALALAEEEQQKEAEAGK